MAGTPVAVTAWVCVAGYCGKRRYENTDTVSLSTAGSVYTTVPVAPTGRVKAVAGARVNVVDPGVPTSAQLAIAPPETPGAESYTKSAYAAVGQPTASL
jgi:hypothetical protein